MKNTEIKPQSVKDADAALDLIYPKLKEAMTGGTENPVLYLATLASGVSGWCAAMIGEVATERLFLEVIAQMHVAASERAQAFKQKLH